jgi:hypothetical protein
VTQQVLTRALACKATKHFILHIVCAGDILCLFHSVWGDVLLQMCRCRLDCLQFGHWCWYFLSVALAFPSHCAWNALHTTYYIANVSGSPSYMQHVLVKLVKNLLDTHNVSFKPYSEASVHYMFWLMLIVRCLKNCWCLDYESRHTTQQEETTSTITYTSM